MNHRWAARAVVVALHAALLAALWLHRPQDLAPTGERRSASVRLIRPERPMQPRIEGIKAPAQPAGPMPTPQIAPQGYVTEPDAPAGTVQPAAPPTAEPPRTTLRLTLPPGYAASAAQRNPALGDPRSNTGRPTLEDRIADATGGAGAWVEEPKDNHALAVGALGDRRTVLRKGTTCVEVHRSRIADSDGFNSSVAPRTVAMMGQPYPCK